MSSSSLLLLIITKSKVHVESQWAAPGSWVWTHTGRRGAAVQRHSRHVLLTHLVWTRGCTERGSHSTSLFQRLPAWHFMCWGFPTVFPGRHCSKPRPFLSRSLFHIFCFLITFSVHSIKVTQIHTIQFHYPVISSAMKYSSPKRPHTTRLQALSNTRAAPSQASGSVPLQVYLQYKK